MGQVGNLPHGSVTGQRSIRRGNRQCGILMSMVDDASQIVNLQNGGDRALADVMAAHRQRLAQIVTLRLDARLSGRVDVADVLQEAFLEARKRMGPFLENPSVPVFVWLRKALALQSSLAEQFPKANAYILWKAILQESLAKMLSDRGRTQEARELLESAVAALNPLLQSEPQAAYIQGMLGRCYRNLSYVLTQMGEKQEAAEMLRRGREHRPAP